MARDAPLHLQRVLLKNRRHIVDLPVARRTADALCDVNAVIEIRVFGQVVNAFPLDRFIVAKACTNRLEIRAVGPELAMAIHAGLRRRHSRGGSRLDRLMAISAIDAVIADVMFMAELHRLLLFEISPGQIRRTSRSAYRQRTPSQQTTATSIMLILGDIVCTFIKELCHLPGFRRENNLYKNQTSHVSQIVR